MMTFSNPDCSLLQVSLWLEEVPLHDIIYLLVFVGVFHVYNFIDILTSVLPTLSFLDGLCPHCFILCLLLQCLTSYCFRIFACSQPHRFILCQLFLLFPFASTLAGMAQRKSSLDFSFFLKDSMSYIPGTSSKGLGKTNMHRFLWTCPSIFLINILEV